MADLRRMTLRSLRALARRTLGAPAARLATREALVRALEKAAAAGEGQASGPRPRASGKAAAEGPVKAKGKALAKGRPAAKATRASGKAKAAPKASAKAKARAKAPARPKAAAKAKPRAEAKASSPAAARGRRPASPRRRSAGDGAGATDPAGFFVARVRGEDAIRGAPHAMIEPDRPPPPAERLAALDEQLGELPASYGEDTLVLLPRDPTSLFAFWDQADDTLREAFRGMERPRAQLWLWARAGDGWERVRVVELALESRGWYLHDLEPGRSYRAELRAVDGQQRERAIGPGSGEAALPRSGASPIVDDRFVAVPWDEPLGPPLGPGRRGADFSADARAALFAASEWKREERPGSARPPPDGEGGAG